MNKSEEVLIPEYIYEEARLANSVVIWTRKDNKRFLVFQDGSSKEWHGSRQKKQSNLRSNKYNAKPIEIDNIRFDSKAESRYYEYLKKEKEKGNLIYFLRQCPLHLPGKTKLVIDFIEFWSDGSVIYTDVKGFETDTFKIKKRQVEELYPFKIKIVKNL